MAERGRIVVAVVQRTVVNGDILFAKGRAQVLDGAFELLLAHTGGKRDRALGGLYVVRVGFDARWHEL